MKLNRTINIFLLSVAILTGGILAGTTTAQAQKRTEKQIAEQTKQDFYNRMGTIAPERAATFMNLVESSEVTERERQALYFLLAYCPLCDIADCEPAYFLRQVRGAYRAREYFKWGPKVPEILFRHFVLPHRINNENMDEARDVFFEELRDRISGMSMYDAALEVNHWCHEKVEYRATDPRTSAPLALVKTSWGRCGEESAFTATALRAVGIPARQVYTPRWVHTDSNHAWVEVWIDGKWHFLGACEPEPELDVAWFTAPATRAMMMHTTVFGKYNGPEEVNVASDLYTTINLLSIYAPTRTVGVTVKDANGNPVPGAKVKFKVYNYSELYPIVTTETNAKGYTSVTTGHGDIMAWASSGNAYGYVKVTPGMKAGEIVLAENAGREYSEDFVMNAPAEGPIPTPGSDKIAENRRRLAEEDSIRNAYMATFADERYAERLAGRTGLEQGRIWRALQKAQGNWDEISDFIELNNNNPYVLSFLESLYEKDLRDTPCRILEDHLRDNWTKPAYEIPSQLVATMILSPRIDMEIISPWRSYFEQNLFARNPGLRDPLALVNYVRENIVVDNTQNYVACLLTPRGVHETRVADARSRNVYFVALCRTAGIPARIERATGKPQFYRDAEWHDAMFERTGASTAVTPRATVSIHSDDSNPIVPAYGSHYTLARFQDGDFQTLDLAASLYGRQYPARVEIPAGYYRLMSGSRANDGSMAAHTDYFDLREGSSKDLVVSLPRMTDKLFVQGILDMNTIIYLEDGTKTSLKEQSNGKGLILVFVDPATEPTRHILQEMPNYRTQLEQWGGGILFVVPGDRQGVTFNESIFSGIPSQATWLTDEGRALLSEAAASLRTDFTNEFPLTLYLNTSGGILFSHKGYRIRLVESLYETIVSEQQMLSKE